MNNHSTIDNNTAHQALSLLVTKELTEATDRLNEDNAKWKPCRDALGSVELFSYSEEQTEPTLLWSSLLTEGYHDEDEWIMHPEESLEVPMKNLDKLGIKVCGRPWRRTTIMSGYEFHVEEGSSVITATVPIAQGLRFEGSIKDCEGPIEDVENAIECNTLPIMFMKQGLMVIESSEWADSHLEQNPLENTTLTVLKIAIDRHLVDPILESLIDEATDEMIAQEMENPSLLSLIKSFPSISKETRDVWETYKAAKTQHMESKKAYNMVSKLTVDFRDDDVTLAFDLSNGSPVDSARNGIWWNFYSKDHNMIANGEGVAARIPLISIKNAVVCTMGQGLPRVGFNPAQLADDFVFIVPYSATVHLILQVNPEGLFEAVPEAEYHTLPMRLLASVLPDDSGITVGGIRVGEEGLDTVTVRILCIAVHESELILPLKLLGLYNNSSMAEQLEQSHDADQVEDSA